MSSIKKHVTSRRISYSSNTDDEEQSQENTRTVKRKQTFSERERRSYNSQNLSRDDDFQTNKRGLITDYFQKATSPRISQMKGKNLHRKVTEWFDDFTSFFSMFRQKRDKEQWCIM